MLDRTKALDAVHAALPAGISADAEATFWTALAQLNASYAALVEQRKRRPAKDESKRWQRINELVDELGKELRAVRKQTRWDAADPMLANRTLEVLTPLKDAAEAHVAGYASINEASSKGRGVAQHFLHGGILDLWCQLGQPIRYSKKNGKPVGPLIRFFTACATPLLGDDMPTARGIADIIDRERKRRIPV